MGFFLERLRRRGEVRVLVAEQLVGDLTGQQHPHVGPFVDGLAAEIHAQAGPDGGDVVGTQQGNDRFQCVEHFLPRHVNFHVIAADVVGHLAGVFQVDGGRCPCRWRRSRRGLSVSLAAMAQTRLESSSAGQETAQGGVGVHAFFPRRRPVSGESARRRFSRSSVQYRSTRGDVGSTGRIGRGRSSDRGGKGKISRQMPTRFLGSLAKTRGAVIQRAVVEGPDADGGPGRR